MDTTSSDELFKDIVSILGKPYHQNKDVLIYNGDSVQLMSKLSSEIIDLTVTSPPYNIGKEYETVMSVEDYVAWSEKWISEVYDITKLKGAMVLNVGYLEYPNKGKAVPIPYLIWDKTDFYLIQEIVWNYGAGVSCKKKLSPRNEKLLWYVKDSGDYTFNLDPIRDPDVKYPNQKKNGKLRCNPLGKNPSDVWVIPKVTSGEGRASKERTSHPAQFPRELIEKVVLGFSNPGDLIFDPFLGSGTVAEVALSLGRKVIGIEINRDYCDIAVKRVKGVSDQSRISSPAFVSLQQGSSEIADHSGLSAQSNLDDLSSRNE